MSSLIVGCMSARILPRKPEQGPGTVSQMRAFHGPTVVSLRGARKTTAQGSDRGKRDHRHDRVRSSPGAAAQELRAAIEYGCTLPGLAGALALFALLATTMTLTRKVGWYAEEA